MNYRETYTQLSKAVEVELIELAKPYTPEQPKDIKVEIEGVGILDDYELLQMWYDEDANDVCFLNEDNEEQMLYFFDLDNKIYILDELKKQM